MKYGNQIKKEWRGDKLPNYDRDLRMEVADVMIYLWSIADELGFNLDDACNEKTEELKKRWPHIWNEE